MKQIGADHFIIKFQTENFMELTIGLRASFFQPFFSLPIPFARIPLVGHRFNSSTNCVCTVLFYPGFLLFSFLLICFAFVLLLSFLVSRHSCRSSFTLLLFPFMLFVVDTEPLLWDCRHFYQPLKQPSNLSLNLRLFSSDEEMLLFILLIVLSCLAFCMCHLTSINFIAFVTHSISIFCLCCQTVSRFNVSMLTNLQILHAVCTDVLCTYTNTYTIKTLSTYWWLKIGT